MSSWKQLRQREWTFSLGFKYLFIQGGESVWSEDTPLILFKAFTATVVSKAKSSLTSGQPGHKHPGETLLSLHHLRLVDTVEAAVINRFTQMLQSGADQLHVWGSNRWSSVKSFPCGSKLTESIGCAAAAGLKCLWPCKLPLNELWASLLQQHFHLRPAVLATYINNVRVHEAGDPLVFANDSGVFVVSAVAVAPTTRLAELDALLASVTLHVVQPDFTWGVSIRRAQSVQMWRKHLGAGFYLNLKLNILIALVGKHSTINTWFCQWDFCPVIVAMQVMALLLSSDRSDVWRSIILLSVISYKKQEDQ